MRIPRTTVRPWMATAGIVAAATMLATVVILATGVGQTHATEPANQQVAENSAGGTAIGTPLSATATGGPVSYSLSGTDAASFVINQSNGEISIAADTSPDFENKSTYELTVMASTSVTVQVVNVNEAGTLTLSSDEPGVGDAISATLTDPDGHITNAVWTWSRTGDGTWNAIAAAAQSSYTTTTEDIGHRIRAEVTYDDAASTGNRLSAATAYAVTNDPPAFPNQRENRTVAENAANGANVGVPVTATDPNNHTITYSVSGDDAFTVSPVNGQITVEGEGSLDYEYQPSHSLTMTATDSHGGIGTTTIVVTVINVDEAGSVNLTHGQLRTGTAVTATISDPDGSISDAAWQWQRSGADIGSATASSYTATSDDVGHRLTAEVSYTDAHGAGKSAQATTSSAVGNDAPSFVETSPQRSIDENAPAGTAVGAAVAATDPNGDPVTYTLVSGNAFSVREDGTIVSNGVLDYETSASHTVSLTATDVHGASADAVVTIMVNNVDEAGVVALSSTAPKVGDTMTANLTDPDGATSAHSWQWQQGDGTTWNDISDAKAGDYTVGSIDIGHLLRAVVSYTDPQGPGKGASAQTTNAVANDPPTFTTADPFSVSIDENNAIDANIGTALVATDPNNDTLTYTVEGDDAANFDVDANGQMTATVSLDHEAKGSHSFTAKVSDPAGGNDEITVNVTVNNVEEVGVVTFDSDTQPEANVALTASLTDPDGGVTGENWQWQSTASTDGPWSNLTGATSATYTPTADDVDHYLRATVSYTDGHGTGTDNASATTAHTVQPEPNQAPRFDPVTTTFNISINVREGVRVAPPFTATDPNGDTLTYSIVSDTANAFTINAETGEVLMGSLEISEGDTYTASISVNDGVNEQWQEDHTADDSLDLTMTMVNPNIVIEPSSRQAFPRGLWVDDDIVVTTNESTSYSRRDQAMVYDRATQQYLEDRSFPVGGRSYPSMQGVWSDGNTIYVLANLKSRSTPKGKVFAYRLSDGARQKSKDISLHRQNSHPYGLTGRDGVMYVGDNGDDKVYAYDIESGDRQSSHEINGIDTLRRDMTDIWLNGETIWISYWLSDFIRAYDVATGERKPGLDIQLARENAGPSGIYSDGFNLWALDSVNDTIYGYVVPQ